jgi:hypothetical protein
MASSIPLNYQREINKNPTEKKKFANLGNVAKHTSKK